MKSFVLMILILTGMLKEDNTKEIVFGGGCFWCSEAIFNQLVGVIDVTPGYSGGDLKNPKYEDVCTGETGHAEVIRIHYNPDQISFERLLEVFFMTHDPTTLNRQGTDIGSQYRSVVFFTTPDQERITREVITRLNKDNIYKNPIVTEVLPLKEFYIAENYHQNYFDRNKNIPYCRYIIQPKIDKFKKIFDGSIKK